MKIENQVCLLQQAKRLKELGVEQESSQYVFVEHADTIGISNRGEHYRWATQYNTRTIPERENYAALTVAELGVMLPFKINDPKEPNYPDYDFYCARNYSIDDDEDPTELRLWSCSYEHDGSCLVLFEPETTEAQARAAMLIHLLENNLVTADEVNKRLID